MRKTFLKDNTIKIEVREDRKSQNGQPRVEDRWTPLYHNLYEDKKKVSTNPTTFWDFLYKEIKPEQNLQPVHLHLPLSPAAFHSPTFSPSYLLTHSLYWLCLYSTCSLTFSSLASALNTAPRNRCIQHLIDSSLVAHPFCVLVSNTLTQLINPFLKNVLLVSVIPSQCPSFLSASQTHSFHAHLLASSTTTQPLNVRGP